VSTITPFLVSSERREIKRKEKEEEEPDLAMG
jgi:hypothetical protein